MSVRGLTADFFTLFALQPVFRIAQAELEERYLALQREAHPDRFSGADEKTRRVSAQLAARINEGYQTLKEPLPRALYLLQHLGFAVGSGQALPAEFLMEQMEWREAILEARASNDARSLEHLLERLVRDLAHHFETLGNLLDDELDYPTAADLTQRLMFLEKLRTEIDETLFDLEDGRQGTGNSD
ncbi:MAG: Fe-S protein assembly co-chaperone HscB [Betaproteobacteria bacterium]|nr:Fe-S protein assembly co-chaperone HscB [Betaproteobacteria bacterium]